MLHEVTPVRADICDLADGDILSVTEAQARIINAISTLTDAQKIPIEGSLGRVIADAVRAPYSIPLQDTSAVDGYALRSSDLLHDGKSRLKLIGTILAGSPYNGQVKAGQCVRIMTGGVIPRGCDTVVMQEYTERNGDTITISSGHHKGQNVRPAGEDITAGQAVLDAGRRITPADMGLLASMGITEVAVTRAARVAFFSTGDELRRAGEPLTDGTIYDSNRCSLQGLLQQTGAEAISMGIVHDNHSALLKTIEVAADQADAVISSGGVSVGDADLVRDILKQRGQIHFWRVGIKPGRPFAFGRIGRAWFFGLPGNPVSAMVTYYQLVQPALRRLMGETPRQPLQFRVVCVSSLKKNPGRMEFQRGILETTTDGTTVVRSTGPQGSNLLSSMSAANCFILLPAEWGDVPAGTLVDVQPFACL